MTVLPFRSDRDVEAAIPDVSRHLASGGLLAYPTETVYGLGSRAVSSDLKALAELKQRGPDTPFLLLVSSMEMVESCGLDLTGSALELAGLFWPGPLTLVLRGGRREVAQRAAGPARWDRSALDFPCTDRPARGRAGPTGHFDIGE